MPETEACETDAVCDFGGAAAAFLHHCRYGRNLSGHTLRAYERDLAAATAHFRAATQVDAIDRAAVRGYAEALFSRGDLKEASIKRRLACLQALFRWLEDEGAVEVSPFHRLRLNIRLPRRLPRGLSGPEMRALVAASGRALGLPAPRAYDAQTLARLIRPGTVNVFTALTAIEVLYATGMRIGELADLSPDRLDIADGTIYLRGKGDRERVVFLPDSPLRELVRAYLDLAHHVTHAAPGPVLVNARGRPATTQFLRDQIRRAGERASLSRRVTPHMLRHTTATHLLEAGVDLRYVQKLLGHQSVATTQMYTAVSNAKLKEVIELSHSPLTATSFHNSELSCQIVNPKPYTTTS